MSSHSEGPGIWFSVWRFLLIHCLYERAAKVLARLRGCAGSPEPSLLAWAISTKFAWRGPNNVHIAKNSVFIHDFKLNSLFPCVCVWVIWSCSRHPILNKPNQLGSSSSSNNFYPQEERGFSHIWLKWGSNPRRWNYLHYKYVIWADALSWGLPRDFREHGDKHPGGQTVEVRDSIS